MNRTDEPDSSLSRRSPEASKWEPVVLVANAAAAVDPLRTRSSKLTGSLPVVVA